MAATNVHDLGQGRAGQGKGKGRGYAATAADATRAEAEPPRYTRDYSHVKKTNMFLRAWAEASGDGEATQDGTMGLVAPGEAETQESTEAQITSNPRMGISIGIHVTTMWA